MLRIEDLAIFGGRPAFGEPLHVGRPNIGDRQRLFARLNRMLDAEWLTNDGAFVRELEQKLAERLGVRHCLAVCNGTIGLEIAIRSAGLHGEVIVPAFTFVATAHALTWLGLRPVFADVSPDQHTLDPDSVERLITPETTGIIGVHLWGQPCQIEELTEIARRHRLTLLFDAAHAMGCTYRGTPIGGFGRAEILSFHATKILNTFEGGAIATNDDELAARVRLLRNFGFCGQDRVVSAGTNGKMNEAAAAMGLTSLESLEDFVEVNRRNHAMYSRALSGIPGVRLLPAPRDERHNFHYLVLDVDVDTAGVSRDQLYAILRAENVLARRYFYPGCHRMAPYSTIYPSAARDLPVTERLVLRVLCLPTGTAVSLEAIELIASIIRLVVEQSSAISARVPYTVEAIPAHMATTGRP